MRNSLIGTNAKGVSVYVYYQMCPECKEPIVRVREKRQDEFLSASPYDVQNLILLVKEKG
jgi:hypothetical protein